MVDDRDLRSGADALVNEIPSANASLRLQTQISQIVDNMKKTAASFPPRLRNLNEQLLEQTDEVLFDNLPV